MNTFKLAQFKAKTNTKTERRTPKHYKTMRFGLILAALMFGGVFYGMAALNTPETEAIEPSSFNAGYLIDDSVFYNPNTMTVAEIQKLLDEKSPACDMWGTGLISGRKYPDGTWVPAGTTRAQYAKVMREKYGNTKYHDPPYVCINKYYENPETHQSLYETQGVATAGMKSAAQIIYDVAREYSINPQVLLVMIKKESLVWGDNWPLKYEYNTVMGYGCPDNAPCNEAYYGFYNQVQKAAWQLNYYREHPNAYRYKPGQNNNIQYHQNTYCGTKQVYLENIATTSLYIYTPYTPNDAALRAYPGTGDGCSSYGNRNFYMFFREWFGSTYAPEYISMVEPRTMSIKTDTMIIDTKAGDVIDGAWLHAGEILFFDSKVEIYHKGVKQTCLRTKNSSDRGTNQCVLLSRLEDFDPNFTNEVNKMYSVNEFTCPINIQNMSINCDTYLDKDDIIKSSKEVVIGSMTYLFDSITDNWYRKDRTKDFDALWITRNSRPFIIPRKMYVNNTSDIINLVTLDTCVIDNFNPTIYFSDKVNIGEKTYFLFNGTDKCGIDSSSVKEINAFFNDFLFPRKMRVSTNYRMVSVLGSEDCASVSAGDIIYFNTKINSNGITYYRPLSSTNYFSSCSIDSRVLVEI